MLGWGLELDVGDEDVGVKVVVEVCEGDVYVVVGIVWVGVFVDCFEVVLVVVLEKLVLFEVVGDVDVLVIVEVVVEVW